MQWSFSTLVGRTVTLRPLQADDAAALCALTPPDTFRYFLNWPSAWTPEAFAQWMTERLFTSEQRPYLVVLNEGRRAVGATSFCDILPVHKHVEIGWTWYVPSVRGTAVNPECKLLMLRHAFDVLGCERVTLKCDARNEHSQRAIAKLGAVREGQLRKHRILQNGYVRDTVYFSIIAEEWPAVRENLEQRMRSLTA